ncbi:hypothetical protein Acsp03_61950 [Actinomadura sp. NBRC 104412]|nr:hypothetical protein Acsp03_61950 [Actinomadura sp. NBRC 104412]
MSRRVLLENIPTEGGNTSISLNGRYYNGDGVYQKTVSRSSDRIYGYGRPAYDSDALATAPSKSTASAAGGVPDAAADGAARTWQDRMRERGWDIAVEGGVRPRLRGDLPSIPEGEGADGGRHRWPGGVNRPCDLRRSPCTTRSSAPWSRSWSRSSSAKPPASA